MVSGRGGRLGLACLAWLGLAGGLRGPSGALPIFIYRTTLEKTWICCDFHVRSLCPWLAVAGWLAPYYGIATSTPTTRGFRHQWLSGYTCPADPSKNQVRKMVRTLGFTNGRALLTRPRVRSSQYGTENGRSPVGYSCHSCRLSTKVVCDQSRKLDRAAGRKWRSATSESSRLASY